MKNEVVIAIFIGCVLGLVIAFGIRNANQAIKTVQSKPTPPPQVLENIQPEKVAPIPENKSVLTITSPENNSLIDTQKVKIVGKTEPNTTILLVYEEGENILSADDEGNFSQEITLTGGQNQISISVFDANGNETNKILSLVYSTAEI